MGEHYIVIGILLDEPVINYLNNLAYFEYKINGYRAIDIKTGDTVDIDKNEYIQLRDFGTLIELDDNLLNHNEVIEVNGKVSFPYVRKDKLPYLRIVDGVVHKDPTIENIELIRRDIEELEAELFLMYDLLEDRLKLTITGSDLPCISIYYLSGQLSFYNNNYGIYNDKFMIIDDKIFGYKGTLRLVNTDVLCINSIVINDEITIMFRSTFMGVVFGSNAFNLTVNNATLKLAFGLGTDKMTISLIKRAFKKEIDNQSLSDILKVEVRLLEV